MKPLATPEQMARADEATIASGVSAEVLMERAGNAVARAVIDVMGGRYGKRVAVVCGTGNNGGDGFVAARALHREGCAVRCFVVGDLDKVKGAAARHLELMRRRGITPEPFHRDAVRGDAIVDAIFGTGFHGTAEGDARNAIDAMNEASAPVVAADIPSGLDGATGSADGAVVEASVTVTMGAAKVGLAVGDGPRYAGRVEVADIGLQRPQVGAGMLELDDIVEFLPHREATDHKRSGSSVAVLAGSDEVPGAPLLTARAAGRMGSGYVTLASTPRVVQAAGVKLPEVLKRRVADRDHLGPEALDEIKDVLDRATVVIVGPGLGRGPDQRALVERVLTEVELPIIVDADGLNVLAGNTDVLTRRATSGTTVITPHPGELATLMGSTVADVQRDRVESARTAARELGCAVVLKGHRTVIARPEGGSVRGWDGLSDEAEATDGRFEVLVNPTGGPVLATAGTGDVLAGAVAALFGRDPHISPLGRVSAGVFVHGVAGDIVALRRGQIGALAWDVAEALPEAISTLMEIS